MSRVAAVQVHHQHHQHVPEMLIVRIVGRHIVIPTLHNVLSVKIIHIVQDNSVL